MNKETRGARTTGESLRVWIALIVLCLVNVVAHLIVMPSLPAQIPTHWGADGSVNGWGPRWMASVLGALPLAFLVMFYVVPRIDPKGEAYRTSGKFYEGFVIAFTLIMCAIGWLCELTVWGIIPARGVVNVAVSTAIGLLFVGIGNYLPRVKQNYTMGSRRPGRLPTPITGAVPNALEASALLLWALVWFCWDWWPRCFRILWSLSAPSYWSWAALRLCMPTRT